MRIELRDEERVALTAVVRNARSILREHESPDNQGGSQSRLQLARDVIDRILRRLTGLELTQNEAEVLADVVQGLLGGAGGEAQAMGGSTTDVLQSLHRKLSFRQVKLSDADTGILLLLLNNTLEIFQNSKTAGSDTETGTLVQKGEALLDEMRRRLGSVELSASEADLVRDTLLSYASVLEKGAQGSQGNAELLRSLGMRLKAGRVELSNLEAAALSLVLNNATSVVHEEGEKVDASAAVSVREAEDELKHLRDQLQTLSLGEQEAELLQIVIGETSKALSAGMAGGADADREALKASQELLRGLHDRLGATAS